MMSLGGGGESSGRKSICHRGFSPVEGATIPSREDPSVQSKRCLFAGKRDCAGRKVYRGKDLHKDHNPWHKRRFPEVQLGEAL